jgi:hypothetical protein
MRYVYESELWGVHTEASWIHAGGSFQSAERRAPQWHGELGKYLAMISIFAPAATQSRSEVSRTLKAADLQVQ